MNIQTIPFSDIAKQSTDIYEDVVIAARRAKQIIDDRRTYREPYSEPDESEELAENVDYVELDKAIGVSLGEFLDSKLEWSKGDADLSL